MFRRQKPSVFSSGYDKLDEALGIQGFPKGRIIELSGPENFLKTSFVLGMISKMQENNIISAYIDVDRDLSEKYLNTAGIDLNKFVLLYANSDTDILENVRQLINLKDTVDLIIIDSAGFINPSKDHQKITAMFRDLLSQLSGIVCDTDVTILVVNQLRSTMDNTSKKRPLCDKIFSAYASVRMRINEADLENGEISIRITGNKFGYQLEEVQLTL